MSDSDASDLDSQAYGGTGVIWDSTKENEELGRIEDHSRPPLPVSQQDPGSNLPTGTGLDGEWTYVEYIPRWTAPDWNDDKVMTTTENNIVTKIPRRDYTQLVRPALLPRDDVRNPTPYARRYGIHPDDHGGRSKMSPGFSDTRCVNLSHAQMTGTGVKAYVDAADLDQAISKCGGTVSQFLETVKNLPQHPKYEPWFAMHRLYMAIKDDEDYQKVMFDGLTTDERIRHQIHSLEPELVKQSTLSGGLHPFLERARWASTTWRGGDEDSPRFVFNLCGNRGEYTAENELIWAALQPALHLVSNILGSNHPAWLEILDLYSRRPMDSAREPAVASPGSGPPAPKVPLQAIFDHFSGPPASNDVRRLRADNSYNVIAAAAEFLQDHLSLELTSALFDSGLCDGAWGITWNESAGSSDPADATIKIELASEMIWPLLVPSYTVAEKATTSAMIASTLLHELAHAANMVVNVLFGEWEKYRDQIPQLAGLNSLDPQILAAFKRAASSATHVRDNIQEAFYRYEQRNELGFAFENQIWGGLIDETIDTTSGAFDQMTFRPLEPGLTEWPMSRGKSHGNKKDKEIILIDPPLPVDSFTKPLQATDTGKLFQNSFWETQTAKFGHRALRLGAADVGVVTLQRALPRKMDRVQALGVSNNKFLDKSLEKLKRAGYAVVCMYLKEVIKDYIGATAMKTRMHRQAEVWPSRDTELVRLWTLCINQSTALVRYYQLVNSSDEEKMAELARQQLPITLDEFKERLVRYTYDVMSRLKFASMDLHQFLMVQIQQTQHMVVEYLQFGPVARTDLYHQYMRWVHNRLEDSYEKAATKVASSLQAVCGYFQQMAIMTTEGVDVLSDTANQLERDVLLFQKAREYLTEAVASQAHGQVPLFASLPLAAYQKRSKNLERLAFRELTHMPTGIRAMVDKCFEVLRIQQPSKEYLAQLNATLVAQLTRAPPPPPAGQQPWHTAQNQPKPASVTNMGATALPPLQPQLHGALGFQGNPQVPAPAFAVPPPTWGTWGDNAVNKGSVSRSMLSTMFGGDTYYNQTLGGNKRGNDEFDEDEDMPGGGLPAKKKKKVSIIDLTED
ncbi:hypothetical protein QBC39DRAFT_350345 [Podospora conica]|nr:hypothetical protein QBC39DRAFT_350345 [Schizothecium conicum]